MTGAFADPSSQQENDRQDPLVWIGLDRRIEARRRHQSMSLLGQSLFDCPTQLLFGDRAVETSNLSTSSIENDRHRLVGHVVEPPDLGGVSERIGDFKTLRVVLAVFDRVVI